MVIRDILLKSIFAFFLGWPIYLGLRRLPRPALIEEPATPPQATAADGTGSLGATYSSVPTTVPSPATGCRCGSPCAGRRHAVALFAVLFFRLWDLQVLSGDKYLVEANNNRTREYRVVALRGEVLASTAKSWSPTEPAWRRRSSTPRNCPGKARPKLYGPS